MRLARRALALPPAGLVAGGRTGARAVPALAGALLALALCGCGGEEASDKGNEETSVVATKSDTEIPTWLSPTDPMDTGRWLASRETGRLVGNDDSASAQMRRGLGRAKGYFIEDPRMIANRTVQLGTMLSEAGMKERYEDLLEDLTNVAQGAKGKQLYGEMCQHYYNTRKQGDDRAATLVKLNERYGAQRNGAAPAAVPAEPPRQEPPRQEPSRQEGMQQGETRP